MGDSVAQGAPHGHKRQPDDELEHEQRLSKRFNLLNLEQNGKLYIPVKAESETTRRPSPPRRRRSNAVTDAIPVDDTKDRVFIHNLDEELAEAEAEESGLVFLPDIERRFMSVPQTALGGANPSPSQSNQMVLYNVPSSLTLPEEQDAVRRAIEDSRARASVQTASDKSGTSSPQLASDSKNRTPAGPDGDVNGDSDMDTD